VEVTAEGSFSPLWVVATAWVVKDAWPRTTSAGCPLRVGNWFHTSTRLLKVSATTRRTPSVHTPVGFQRVARLGWRPARSGRPRRSRHRW
jgi:hypothetical protein